MEETACWLVTLDGSGTKLKFRVEDMAPSEWEGVADWRDGKDRLPEVEESFGVRRRDVTNEEGITSTG